MACACRLSVLSGLLKEKTSEEILSLIHDADLPIKTKNIRKDAILKTLAYDKKFLGKTNRFVLLKDLGRTKIAENIPHHFIETVVEEICFSPKG